MKLLLTAAPFWNEPDAPAPRHISSCAPLAPYLLATILEERGHEVKVLDPSALEIMMEEGTFVGEFLGNQVVGISSTGGAWPNARKIIEPFKNTTDRPTIVLGGPHPTAFPEHILSSTPADFVVIGEGDETFPELIDALAGAKPIDGVAGIAWRDGDSIRSSAARELLSPDSLAALPHPDFSGLPRGYYDVIPAETSRGCPHQCAFCSIKFGRGIREMEPHDATQRIGESARWVSLSSKAALFMVDDCFTVGAGRVAAVADMVEKERLGIALEARVIDLLRDEILDPIIRMDPVKIEIGVECGYPEGMRRVGKGITVEMAEECADRLARAGLAQRTRFSFVMGLPWEGRREVTDTMKFAARLGARSGGHVQLNWFTCYPRSPIHRDALRWGIDIQPEDYDQHFWWKDTHLFERTHPKLTPKEAMDTLEYLELLKNIHPGITFEGLIGI